MAEETPKAQTTKSTEDKGSKSKRSRSEDARRTEVTEKLFRRKDTGVEAWYDVDAQETKALVEDGTIEEVPE